MGANGEMAMLVSHSVSGSDPPTPTPILQALGTRPMVCQVTLALLAEPLLPQAARCCLLFPALSLPRLPGLSCSASSLAPVM